MDGFYAMAGCATPSQVTDRGRRVLPVSEVADQETFGDGIRNVRMRVEDRECTFTSKPGSTFTEASTDLNFFSLLQMAVFGFH